MRFYIKNGIFLLTVWLILAAALILSTKTFAQNDVEKKPYATKEINNIVYKVAQGQEIKLNLFLPTAEGEPISNAPLLIDIVSGGWNSPGPGDGGFWRACKSVERGFAVASVAHRSVAPDCIFPAQIEDIKAAVRFLRAHAKEYGIDPNRIAAYGTSSGGHMASMLGISDKFRLFDVGENLEQSSQVQIVIDLCCTADMAFYLERSPEQTPEPVYSVLGASRDNNLSNSERAAPIIEKARKYSPITYVDNDFSPTLILQGTRDQAVIPSQSCLFYEALNRAGVRTELYLDNSQGHTANLFPWEERIKLIFDFLQWSEN
ncbi:MAG: alpha/beta hydrolase [Planctomycetia bacterium]|nr:alpha/beta hydrolase [Planctomycetia bacterium]